MYCLCTSCVLRSQIVQGTRCSDKHFLSNTGIALTAVQNTVYIRTVVSLKSYYKCFTGHDSLYYLVYEHTPVAKGSTCGATGLVSHWNTSQDTCNNRRKMFLSWKSSSRTYAAVHCVGSWCVIPVITTGGSAADYSVHPRHSATSETDV